MKRIIVIMVLVSGLMQLKGQDKDETPVITPKPDKVLQEPRLSYHLSLGTSVLSAKGYGTGVSSYVSPELSYKLSPKFRVNAGVMFFQTRMGYINFQRNYSDRSAIIKTPATYGALAYVSGDYTLNNRLTISGMVMRNLNNLNGNSMYQSGYNAPVQAMSLHMDYKLTDHITIGAGVHMSQGNRWNYPSLYNGYNYSSPYYYNSPGF